jgi:hypothetical protein
MDSTSAGRRVASVAGLGGAIGAVTPTLLVVAAGVILFAGFALTQGRRL